jgi:hypothetical protein
MRTNEIINRLVEDKELTFEESFSYASTCSLYLDEVKSEINGRRILINILDQWVKIPLETHEIWTDLIEIAGFYPYLEKEKGKLPLRSLSGKIRKEYHNSENLPGKYFQEEQKQLLDLIKTNKNVVVSAPTSFGKSLLIEEIVASKEYTNIVIIQPTLALLEETRRKLLKYSDTYKIIVRTSQEPVTDKGNLFLLTAERVYEYQDFPHIDFLIIDEFYKLSAKRNDTRSDVLNNSFYSLYKKFKCRFYLLGPNIDGISKGFEDNYNSVFFKTDYSLVDCFVENICNSKGEFFKGNKEKEKALFSLLARKNKEQSIVYCSSPDRALSIAMKFEEFLNEEESITQKIPLIEWIEQNITKHWGFVKLLKKGIGVHVGSLPKHITTSIIDYFNEGKLKYLFCTTTIIEGVNTSAKNMIFFDNKKGGGKNSSIDYFDYANIKGRSGRLMVHYTGNMYNFNPVPPRENLIIDIPFFQQNPITPEVLINIDEADVRDKLSDDFKLIKSLPEDEKKLYRQNSMSVFGQKKLYDFLMLTINTNHKYINWTVYPKYDQLKFVLEKSWEFLKSEGDSSDPVYSSNQLCKFAFDYVRKKQILKDLIRSRIKNHVENRDLVRNQNPPTWMKSSMVNAYLKMSDNQILHKSINEAFKLKKNWFEYKLPKWLKTFNSIQSLVCSKNNLTPGSYLHYASVIENEFIPENLAILTEFGIPISAIRKLDKLIPSKINEDSILDYIKKHRIIEKAKLIEYEADKIKSNFVISKTLP